MQKINFQDLPSTATPINASNLNLVQSNMEGAFKNSYSTSQDDGYSCDFINDLNTYSTTEQRIGTWIDGKPVYQKTIDFGALPNNTSKSVAHGISNLDKMIKIDGVINGNFQFTIPHITPTYYVAINTSSTVVTITTNTDRSQYTAFVTLRYTKTTD